MSQYNVPTAFVAFGAWFASVSAGVQLTEVFAVFVAIVPDAEPTAYLKVWVKEDDAGLSVIVDAEPIVSVPTEGVVARGIVVNEIVAEPDAILIAEENEQSADQANVTLPVPSALCVIVHSPYAAASVDALSVRIVKNLLSAELLYEVLYCVV